MRQVRECVYIGKASDAAIYLSGVRRGFTHILSVAPVCLKEGCDVSRTVQPYWEYIFDGVDAKRAVICPELAVDSAPVRKIIPLLDESEQEILSVLPECFEFIEEGVKSGLVLVHCIGGFSRSATVVAAYLMWKEGLKFHEALESLKKSHEGVRPNAGFVKQLQALELVLLTDGKLEHRERQDPKELACKLCKRTFSI